jgi:hypothetical protein
MSPALSRGHTDHRESFAASEPPVGRTLGNQISPNRSAMRCILSNSQRTTVPAATPRYPAISHQSLPLRFHSASMPPLEADRELGGSR